MRMFTAFYPVIFYKRFQIRCLPLWPGILTILACHILAFDLLYQQLPSDVFDAEVMIEAGEIDSTLWNQLEPFYHRPLEVPAGELMQLHDLFPEYASGLPVASEILDRYRPWNEDAVNRFCTDFPLVEKCMPVLRFDFSEQRSCGTAAFYLYPVDTRRAHSMRVSLTPASTVRAGSDIDLTESSARFRRRFFEYRPSSRFALKAGNTTLFDDGGLFFGSFAPDVQTGSDVLKNIAAAGTPAWNGIAAKVSQPLLDGTASGITEVFAHYRPTESVQGMLIGIEKGKRFSGEAGYIRSRLSEDERVFSFAVARGVLRSRNYVSSITAGAHPQKPGRIPFFWENRIRAKEGSFTVNITRMPAFFDAPQSRVLQRFFKEMDADELLSDNITLVQMTGSISGRQPVAVVPSAALWFSGGNIHHSEFSGTIRARSAIVEGNCRFTTGIARSEAGDMSLLLSKVDGEVTSVVSKFAVFRFVSTLSLSESKFNYFRWSFAPHFSRASGSVVSPTISGVLRADGNHELVLGCRHRQALFRNTFSELHVEKSFAGVNGKGCVYVDGSAAFLF